MTNLVSSEIFDLYRESLNALSGTETEGLLLTYIRRFWPIIVEAGKIEGFDYGFFDDWKDKLASSDHDLDVSQYRQRLPDMDEVKFTTKWGQASHSVLIFTAYCSEAILTNSAGSVVRNLIKSYLEIIDHVVWLDDTPNALDVTAIYQAAVLDFVGTCRRMALASDLTVGQNALIFGCVSDSGI